MKKSRSRKQVNQNQKPQLASDYENWPLAEGQAESERECGEWGVGREVGTPAS